MKVGSVVLFKTEGSPTEARIRRVSDNGAVVEIEYPPNGSTLSVKWVTAASILDTLGEKPDVVPEAAPAPAPPPINPLPEGIDTSRFDTASGLHQNR